MRFYALALFSILVGLDLPETLAGEAASVAPAGRVSPKIFAAVIASLPSYAELQASAPSRTGSDDDVMMAPVVVSGLRAGPDGTGILTKAGLSELLAKKFPGASFKGQDPYASVTPNYAALMYRDEVRADRLTEVSLLLAPKGPEERQLKKEMYDAFIRRPTWQEEGMDRSVNHYRR